MNICQPHWDRLKQAIYSRGLNDFIAADGKEIIRQVVKSVNNPDTLALEDFDPLLAANNMISSFAMQHAGLSMLVPDAQTGKLPCPLCLVAGPHDQNWIDGACDQAAEMVKELRCGPVNLKAKRDEADGLR